MSDDLVFKMCESQTELEKIQKQNNKIRNEIVFEKLIETVNELQSKVDVLEQTVTALSNRASNHADEFSKLNENLRQLNEKLDKDDTILRQCNEVPPEQNETTQVLSANQNNLEKQAILLVDGQKNGKRSLPNLLMLENDGQNWKELNIKLPYAVHSHGAQFLNNNLYIFGGYVNGKPSNWTYKLSKSLKWEKMADMNEKREAISNSSVILNDQIWVCGGRHADGDILASVEIYDPLTNRWKEMKEQMHECRAEAAAAVVNGKIFCSGGTDIGAYSNSVECYDPSSGVWTFVCYMPRDASGCGALEMNGNLILVGGESNWDKGNSKSVWTLNVMDKNAGWIEKPSMSKEHYPVSIAKINHKVYVCGGYPRESRDSVEIFDGEVWRDGPKLPTYHDYSPAVVIPIEFARYFT